MKKIFKSLILLGLIINLIGCDFNSDQLTSSTIDISFLKVGKADAIIITHNKEALIIDTAEDEDAPKLLNYLKTSGIKTIKALIITHFDKDHVGAADKLIAEYPIETIYVPDYLGHHDEYLEFINCVNAKHLELTKVHDDISFDFADATFSINATKLFDDKQQIIDNDNNHSLITTMKHGSLNFLFMADAEDERLDEWLKLNNEVQYSLIKMPHHGAYNPLLMDLMTQTKATYAVITDSKKNPADDKTLEILNEAGSLIFRTKKDSVKAISDGQKLDIFYVKE